MGQILVTMLAGVCPKEAGQLGSGDGEIGKF